MRTLLVILIPMLPAATAGEPTAPLRTDSRMPYVHRISLYDRDGEIISSDDDRPYSTTATCGKCHPVGRIAAGWHFDAARADIPAGRPGEPWIYADRRLGIQLPLSYRHWPGTWTPQQVGLSDWDFAKHFGHHLPGGGPADPAQAASAPGRWTVAGGLEIDCLLCHNADHSHDPAERWRQIQHDNFRQAATAALGLGVVRGASNKLPDDFDPLFYEPNPDRPDLAPPTIEYDPARFDPDDRVFIAITARPPPERCAFCHAFRDVATSGPRPAQPSSSGPRPRAAVVGQDARPTLPGSGPRPARPPSGETPDPPSQRTPAPRAAVLPADQRNDRDVHLNSGLICVDCHFNGIDHMIRRGDRPSDTGASEPPSTCRGCHLGTGPLATTPDATAGALGAPYPLHPGLPPLHFDKLTCTACHSGPWPTDTTTRVQTALNHGLGLPSRTRGRDDWPIIIEPVFARDANGRIGLYRLVWPAYWGLRRDGHITPLPLPTVRRIAQTLLAEAGADAGGVATWDEQKVAAWLAVFDERVAKSEQGQVVYVRSGRAYALRDGRLVSDTAAEAASYRWPIAHDVRPASQSLGVRGCTDCHAADAPIDYARLDAGPSATPGTPLRMIDLRGDDATERRVLAWLFVGRGPFKLFGLLCVVIVGVVILRHALAGIGREAAS